MLNHLNINFWSFLYILHTRTSSPTPDFVGRSCCAAVNREDALRRPSVLEQGEKMWHKCCFHVLLQGVNGHKCSQLVCVFETLDHNHSPPSTHQSCCVLCHVPLRKSWTGCLIVHMYSHTTRSSSHTGTQRVNHLQCQCDINLVYFLVQLFWFASLNPHFELKEPTNRSSNVSSRPLSRYVFIHKTVFLKLQNVTQIQPHVLSLSFFPPGVQPGKTGPPSQPGVRSVSLAAHTELFYFTYVSWFSSQCH